MLNRRKFIGLAAAGITAGGAVALILGKCRFNDLSGASSKAWHILMEGLQSADPLIQAESARLLGDLGSPDALPDLLQYVQTSGYYSKTAGLYAIQCIGNADTASAIAPLVENPGVYDDFYWHYAFAVRSSAALAVLALNPNLNVPFFKQELEKESHPQLNMFCIYYASALTSLSGQDVTSTQLKKRTSSLCFSRQFLRPAHLTLIADALGKTGTESAYRELQWMLSLPSRYTRGAAAANLPLCMPSAEARSQLQQFFKAEETTFAKVKSAGALARLGDADADRYLRRVIIIERDALTKATAIKEASVRPKSMSLKELSPQLKDPSPWVRAAALEALERTIDPESRTAAAVSLEDADAGVRMQAAKTLLVLHEGKWS